MSKAKYLVVGATHIDLAWKRDSSEMAELLEIFVTRLLDILETNPNFTYLIEQVFHYRRLAERRPDLIARLKRFLKEGRLELVGGLASTAETNGPDGESFIRNQLLGLKWIHDNFGIEVTTGWLIDTFGLNAQIPQILRQFGFQHLMANRFGGTIDRDVFLIQGLDGSRILVAGRDVYSPYVRPGNVFFKHVLSWDDIDELFEKAAAEGNKPCLVMPYTEEGVVPSLRPVYHITREEDKGEWRFCTLREYFDALESLGAEWPIVHGDLNPEFTGTFGQRVIVRLRNRKVETLLLEAEKWASLLSLNGWQRELEEAWWDVVFNQSHDVFTGSHPTKVLREALSKFDRAEGIALRVLNRAFETQFSTNIMRTEGISILVFNGLPWGRRDIVSLVLPDWLLGVKNVSDGESNVPFEVVDGNLRFLANIPPVGLKTFAIEPISEKPVQLSGWQTEKAMIENEYIYFECDTCNGIRQLVWKQTGKALLTNCGDFLVVQQDRGSFQIEEPVGSEVPAIAGGFNIYRYNDSELAQHLVISGVFPQLPWAGEGNALSWEAEFSLIPGKPRLDVILKIHWKGEASRIRFKLTTNIDSSEGIYEIPFGVVRRKPYRDRGTARGEWPARRFVAVEEREKYGLALINTGISGVEVNGGTIWTTLLRAPKSKYAGMVPDDTSSQHGNHIFQFAIAPYVGTWSQAGVIQEAQEVNIPFMTTIRKGISSQFFSRSFLSLSPNTVVLSAVKSAEDGSNELVVRFYESVGQQCVVSLFVSGAQEAWLSDLREKKYKAIACLDGNIDVPMKPFEIKTLRVRC